MSVYNTASTALNAAKNLVTQQINWTMSDYILMDKWSATKGNIQKDFGWFMPADKLGVLAVNGNKPDKKLPRVLTFTDAAAMATQIDLLAVGSDHLKVKDNLNWCKIYQRSDRNFPTMNKVGTIVQKSIDSIPCHNCGLVTPITMVQVDHHMPQAVGGEGFYTLKMARALGLTKSKASGGKGLAILGGTLAGLILNPKERNSSYDHLLISTESEKWETNDKGAAFLSLLAYAPGALESVQSRCKNSVLNLVPLCGDCNRNKSDWIKPLA